MHCKSLWIKASAKCVNVCFLLVFRAHLINNRLRQSTTGITHVLLLLLYYYPINLSHAMRHVHFLFGPDGSFAPEHICDLDLFEGTII